MDAEVLPYHWDDRARLFDDYQYLKNLYERLLQSLTVQLNQIHNVDHSPRYWRILIGPWLGYFTQILFDRWTSIQEAKKQYELSGTFVVTFRDEAMVPNDMQEFRPLYPSDEWNHHLYSAILQQFTDIDCTKQTNRATEVSWLAYPARTWKRKIMKKVADGYTRVASLLTREQDAFFIATYLSRLDEMRLNRRMGQAPQLWRKVSPVRVAVNCGQRQWVVSGEDRTDFEVCVRTLIPQQMPAAYLEGYGRLVEQAAGLPWPGKPKLIWTSNAYSEDDVFKAWAAEKVEQGSPLVISQHGGHYGVGRWSSTEEHEIDISDCFLSWGWTEPDEPKIRPLGQFNAKKELSGVSYAEKPGAMLVTASVPRYSYRMYSIMVSRQWLDYFEDQCVFVEHLPPQIRDALTVRLYPEDYGWDQAARWHDRFPGLGLDKGSSSIDDLIRRSRIYISTYNATTFLESFTMDVPTVIYWNPDHWELRDSAVPYFDDLKQVGIFHDKPESAARHVAAVWDDIDSWWRSPAVRAVLKRFRGHYCALPDEPLDSIEHALDQVTAASGRQD